MTLRSFIVPLTSSKDVADQGAGTSVFGTALGLTKKLRGEHSESDQTTLNIGHALHPADQPAMHAHRAWR